MHQASLRRPAAWVPAVDLIAARMEEHRARSGLFYDNWEALPEEEGLPGADGYSGGGSMYGQGGSLEEQAAYEAAAEQADEEAATEARGLS